MQPWLRWLLIGAMASLWVSLLLASRLHAPGWLVLTMLGALAVSWTDCGDPRTGIPLWMICIVAIVFRGMAFAAVPAFENDWIRYLFDGLMVIQHGSPYDIVPLERFGDEQINELFAERLDFGYPHIPTIYGPVSMWVFAWQHGLHPHNCGASSLLSVLLNNDFAAKKVPNKAWQAYALCPFLFFETWMNVTLMRWL